MIVLGIGLIFLAGYLFYVLINPEKF
ncbi:K(+)-transporting ATPase subunit F [Anaerotignum sp. MB30-C6]